MERGVGMEGWGFPISWSLSALLRGSVNSHQVGVALEVPLWSWILASYDHLECARCLQEEPGSTEQGAGWTNIAQFLFNFSKPSIVGAETERMTFEPGNPLTEICQRGLKGQHCLQSSAFVVSSLAVVISAKKHPLRKVSSSLARQMRTTYWPAIKVEGPRSQLLEGWHFQSFNHGSLWIYAVSEKADQWCLRTECHQTRAWRWKWDADGDMVWMGDNREGRRRQGNSLMFLKSSACQKLQWPQGEEARVPSKFPTIPQRIWPNCGSILSDLKLPEMPFEVASRKTGVWDHRVTCQLLQSARWLCDNSYKLMFGQGTSLSVIPSKFACDSACGGWRG